MRPMSHLDSFDMNQSIRPMAKKLGLPDHIMPDDVRNDLYLTIYTAELDKLDKVQNRTIEIQVEFRLYVCR